MLISVPLFDSATYVDDDTSYDTGLRLLQAMALNSDGFNTLFKSYIFQQSQLQLPLIIAVCQNVTWESGTSFGDLRSSEYAIATYGEELQYIGFYDLRYSTKL
jgi:hypothetical protein